jgi:hypothetical protein
LLEPGHGTPQVYPERCPILRIELCRSTRRPILTIEPGLSKAPPKLSHRAIGHGRDVSGKREKEEIEMRRGEEGWGKDARDGCSWRELREMLQGGER